MVLGIRPGQRVVGLVAFYGKGDQVPIRLLALWVADQQQPWYLARDRPESDQIETLYRWRMRLECANRDERSSVILREESDQHGRHNVVHLHRPLLGLAAAEWLYALVGLQAVSYLPQAELGPLLSPNPIRSLDDLTDSALLDHGPAPVLHCGERPKPPRGLQRFVAWGSLSYVRLGGEVLRSPNLLVIIQRLTRWLAAYPWSWTPRWHPPQLRYRLRAW